MDDNDKKDFLQVMTDTGDVYGKEITTGLASTYFNALIEYPIEQVKQAFSGHTRNPDRGRFFPKPADLIFYIQESAPADTQCLGPNEAWAVACHIDSENESAAVTKEIIAAKNIADECPDRVSGRMAFIEAYNRLCKQSRDKGEQPVWFMSLGSDKDGRRAAIEQAASNNLITQRKAEQLLPDLRDDTPQLTNLLESAAKAAPTNDHAKQAIEDLKTMFATK